MTLRQENPLAYGSWQSMKQRCLNSNCASWDDYGGRGIGICAQWVASFETFLADMGERPSADHSLERLDNDGDYEPANCVWATLIEQAQNRKKPHRPNPSGMNVVDHGYLLGYLPASQNAYRTVIRPYEIPGRPEYKGETEEVRKRIKHPNAWI